MTEIPSLARHGALPAPGARICRILGFLALLPVLGPASCVAYVTLVPPYSASILIPEINTRVALQFYWVWSPMWDEGRRLTVAWPGGVVRLPVCGYDWSHWSRTSVYLTEDRDVAVVGPGGCAYRVSVARRSWTEARDMPSDKWTYLGAFDFVDHPHRSSERELRFVPASEQAECIEMMGAFPIDHWLVRREARKPRCP